MTIAAIGLCSIRRDASRAFVRAAFTSGSYNNLYTPSTIAGSSSTSSHHHPVVGAFVANNHNFAKRNHLSLIQRSMSSAPVDEELDNALSEMLGEAASTLDEAVDSSTVDDAVDEELDNALGDILGEVFKEVENPAVDDEVGGRGHIEGSHPFPQDLVVEVSFYLIHTQFGIVICGVELHSVHIGSINTSYAHFPS